MGYAKIRGCKDARTSSILVNLPTLANLYREHVLMKISSKKRLLWIDLEKGIAIIAVVIGHLSGLIYDNPAIYGFIAFSVTLFIIVSGYTSAYSFENAVLNSEKTGWQYLWKRLGKILLPYFVATLIYHIYSSGYEFILSKFLEKLFLFNSRPPFYFIAVYIQLLIVSPIIIKNILKKNFLCQIIFLLVIYYLCVIFTTRTHMFDLWGGGENLLGGTYLFAFSFGVFLFDRLRSMTKSHFYIIGGIVALLTLFFLKDKMYASTFSNPPNNSLLLYSSIVFLIIFLIGNWFEKTIFSVFLKPLAFLGKYSLYIYFYHTMAIEITTEVLIRKGWISKPVQSYFYVLFALLSPILVVKAYNILVRLTNVTREKEV